jgi:lipopolysaccharide/colanic/teichoic acid biosynthesis glycosyltransferase
LLARHTVRPGITGLWQAEARDNKYFEVYQRLDLFYVENWTLLLDFVILLATADQIVLRPFFKWRERRQQAEQPQVAAAA